MIKRLYLKNFRNFNELDVSFMQTSTMTKNIAFIYGENGVGKTNLIEAFKFIFNTTKTLTNDYLYNNMPNRSNDRFYGIATDYLFGDVLYNSIKNLLLRNKRLLSANENLVIEYEFCDNSNDGSYTMVFDNDKIVFEEFKYTKNKNLTTVFKIGNNENEDWFDDEFIFTDRKFKEEAKYYINKYRGNHTFISIINYLLLDANKQFMETAIGSKMAEALQKTMNVVIVGKNSNLYSSDVLLGRFINTTIAGTFKLADEKTKAKLEQLAEELSFFYGLLYRNIVGVKYNYVEKNDGILYDLVFVERNYKNEVIEVKFEYESTGTKKLMNLFFALKEMFSGKTILIDEIDSDIHDVLILTIVKNLISYKRKNKTGQFIATTHNTLLMKELKARDVYILNTDNNGKSELYSLSEYGKEIQATNNISKRYLEGLYGGIPFTCFSVESIKEKMQKTKDN